MMYIRNISYIFTPSLVYKSVWIGVVRACILIFVWLRGKICVREWCCEIVGSSEVQQVARCSLQHDKNLCAGVCVMCMN